MHIYFSGIGGAAIGPLALICRDAGHKVVGSDISEGLFTERLKDAGVNVFIGQDKSQIAEVNEKQPIDWLVVSSSVSEDSPEVIYAKEHGIKVTKRADMINFILKERNLKMIAIAGTHGKTTTTAMLVWLFKMFNTPVSYSIGSNISFGESGAYKEDSEYFIYECDEYDRNMLEFKPFISLILNIDYDHSDIYPTKESYREAFKKFADQSQSIVLWKKDADIGDGHKNVTYLEQDGLIKSITLPGIHNRENASAAIKTFLSISPNLDEDEVIDKMNKFPGTERRFECLADGIYTDYAHHPAEIRATVQLAREVSNNIVVVYQPHQNIRQHENVNEYKDCFNGVSKVYWLPTYLARENPELDILTQEDLIKNLEDPSVAEVAEMNDELVSSLKKDISKGSTIVFMGAGSIDEWARKILSELE